MDATRKTVMAIGLVLAWGGLAYWQWVALPGPVHAPLVNVSGPPGETARALSPSGGLRVHLEQLATARTQREATFTAPRNIFAVPSSGGPSSGAGDEAGANGSAQVSEQELQRQAAALELAQYRYLGFVRMGEFVASTADTAVLSKNDDVMIGRAGQYLERHLVVKAVTAESVTLRDTQARIDHTVPLTEDVGGPQP